MSGEKRSHNQTLEPTASPGLSSALGERRMSSRYVDTEPLDSLAVTVVEADGRMFVENWRSSSLATTGIDPDGVGSVADIEALDYVIYESVYGLVVPVEKSFIALSASVFGKCLKTMLGFEWCRVHLPAGPVLGVRHPYNDLMFPLEAIIASHLSGDPQYENFSYLFIKVLQSKHAWPIGSHFLEESTWALCPEDFERHWGFSVPESLSRRYLHLSAVDEGSAIRGIGLLAYDWKEVPEWNAIDRRLSEMERDYVSTYGVDWRDRLKLRSPQLFT